MLYLMFSVILLIGMCMLWAWFSGFIYYDKYTFYCSVLIHIFTFCHCEERSNLEITCVLLLVTSVVLSFSAKRKNQTRPNV